MGVKKMVKKNKSFLWWALACVVMGFVLSGVAVYAHYQQADIFETIHAVLATVYFMTAVMLILLNNRQK
jgi:flagellar motor component MotA